MKRSLAITVVVVPVALLVGVALYVDRSRSSAAGAAPDLRDAQRISAGQAIYDGNCAACHGANLEGQPNWTTRLPNGRLPAPPHDDSGHTWHHPNEILFEVTKNGLKPPHAPAGYVSDMPTFADRLTDDEIWNVLAFIQSRWSERVRARHDQFEQQLAEQRRSK